MKKVLFVATVVQKHINVFHLPFLKQFQANGYKTYVAASNDTEQPKVEIPYCDEYVEIKFKRNPFHPSNIPAFFKLRKLIRSNRFDIIHCHTPVGGVLGRLASIGYRKKGMKVYYTAHGFHFYKGAPLKNWLLYYPIEKLCSYFTDVLLTINLEDYDLAKRKMKAKKVEYTPGVGIDLSRFATEVDRKAKREEIGVPEDAFLLLSVGEVNENKNHKVIVQALAKLNDPSIHYAIAGIGPEKDRLLALADQLGVGEQLHLLGYRKDVPQLNRISDVFCFPSQREGLGLAAIEAMSCGLPIVTSDIRGINDYSIDGVTGYKCAPTDAESFAKAIATLKNNSDLRMTMGAHNVVSAQKYDIREILPQMKEIYQLQELGE